MMSDWNEGKEPVVVDYDEVKKKTQYAWIFKVGDDEVIIPESEMENQAPDEEDKTFTIPRWLAEDRGLV